MASIRVRSATLDDLYYIVRLARQQVMVWQRVSEDGSVLNLPYEDLTVYERWLHGGAWMSLETASLQLGRLLLGHGLPLVMTHHEKIIGYVEVFLGDEPAPFGRNLHLATLYLPEEEALRAEVLEALLAYLNRYALQKKCQRITLNNPVHNHEGAMLYEQIGFAEVDTVRRMILSAKTGQVFYKATEYHTDDSINLTQWHLRIGRVSSSTARWQAIMPYLWEAMPQYQAQTLHRIRMNVAGHDAYVAIHQHLYNPRLADVTCWTPVSPTAQLITAIRDWAHRNSYRKLVLLVSPSDQKILGLEAESDGYIEQILARAVEAS